MSRTKKFNGRIYQLSKEIAESPYNRKLVAELAREAKAQGKRYRIKSNIWGNLQLWVR